MVRVLVVRIVVDLADQNSVAEVDFAVALSQEVLVARELVEAVLRSI